LLGLLIKQEGKKFTTTGTNPTIEDISLRLKNSEKISISIKWIFQNGSCSTLLVENSIISKAHQIQTPLNLIFQEIAE
jgi:hypothetical protein